MIVKVQITASGKWAISGKGAQNYRLIPDDKVPAHVRERQKNKAGDKAGDLDPVAFYTARWDRALAQWFVGERVAPPVPTW